MESSILRIAILKALKQVHKTDLTYEPDTKSSDQVAKILKLSEKMKQDIDDFRYPNRIKSERKAR